MHRRGDENSRQSTNIPLIGASFTGTVTVKVLPSPTTLSRAMSPLIIDTSCFDITKPNPVPPYCRVVRAESACLGNKGSESKPEATGQ